MSLTITQLLEQLGKRADRLGINSLSDMEQTVLVPWWTLGVVGNGGFRYFLEFATNGLCDASRRFETLGLHAASQAIDQACRVLKLEGREPLAEAERLEIIRSTDWDVLDEAEGVLFRLGFEELEATIEVYARLHGLLEPLASA